MISLDDLDYELPEELIAQHPLDNRSKSKLLVFDRKSNQRKEALFFDLVNFLDKDTILVINDSKVYPARLFARKSTSGKVELLLLERLSYLKFKVMLRPFSRIVKGERLSLDEGSVTIIDKLKDGIALVEFAENLDPLKIAQKYGKVPLPPYIKRKKDENLKVDRLRYQSLFAKNIGSIAAPTASLHFSKNLIESIINKGIKIVPITLHVGEATFRPLSESALKNNNLSKEKLSISKETADTINKARSEGKKIVALGTTVVRGLEGALNDKTGKLKQFDSSIDIFIKPGFKFKIVDHIITNFHLPRSSLLGLVFAFAGKENILSLYNHAIKNRYRFYSFGDAMLII